MKKFQITVNGKAYEVEVEEMGGGSTQAPRAAAPAPAPAAAPAPKAAPAAAPAPKAAAVPAGSESVTAPMPGKVMSIKVTTGQAVTAGDLILVLEAMKMENSLGAPCDGTVKALCFGSGDSVAKDTVLAVIG